MSEPWLSDLSEDWKTPSSASASSVPKKPAATGTAPSSSSRIPRATKKIGSPAGGSNNPRSSPANRRTLSERSRSENNILSHSSSQRHPSKPSSRLSYSSSTSSVGSVVRHDTAARQAQATSQVKSKTSTPEWRKRLLKGQADQAQANLFSPMGLENIFQPGGTSKAVQHEPQKHFSFLQDLESMPSSPPPWPKNHRGSKLSLKPTSVARLRGRLGILREQDEDHGEVSELKDSVLSDNNDISHAASLEDSLLASHQPAFEDTVATKWAASSQSLDGSTDESPEVQGPEILTNQRGLPNDDTNRGNDDSELSTKRASSTMSGNASSVVGRFSPVYISKHNTTDGRIDYAAVDLSNPVILEQLRQSQESRNSAATEPQSVLAPSFQQSQSLAPISEFVNVDRGGFSDQSSFLRRPLSSSASSSIVPSDSVSQIRTADDRTERRFQSPSSENVFPDALNQKNTDVLGPACLKAVDEEEDYDYECVPQNPNEGTEKVENVALGFNDEKSFPSLNQGEDESQKGYSLSTSYESSGPTGSVQTVLYRAQSERNEDIAHPNVGEYRDSTNSGELSDSSELAIIDTTQRPSTPPRGSVETNDLSPNKRAAELHSKPPTPKRIRTLTELNAQPHPEPSSDIIDEPRMQAIIGKRKDARYDDFHKTCDPAELARREILRPRNLALNQQLITEIDNSFQQSVESNAHLRTIQEHIALADLNCNATEEAEIKALATEVATVRIKEFDHADGEVRKHSVSTQDYVDEAMKIMEMIRSSRKPQVEFSSIEEAGWETPQEKDVSDEVDLTPQTISRPPSRDGPLNAWRTRESQPLNTELADQLKMYQETGEESLLATSAFGDLPSEAGGYPAGQGDDPRKDDSSNIRISGPPDPSADHITTESVDSSYPELQPHSRDKSRGSNRSTDSSGRTVGTSSTQKTRTMAVIGPEQVSHLIRNEEAGMRYDPERHTWVKCKILETSGGNDDEIPGSTNTDDEDPFGAISDLSIIDEEYQEFEEGIAALTGRQDTQREVQNYSDLDSEDIYQDLQELKNKSETVDHRGHEVPGSLSLHRNERVSLQETDDAAERHENAIEEDLQAEEFVNSITHDLTNAHLRKSSLALFQKLPNHSAKSPGSQRRNVSVNFSSPPVVSQYAARQWSDLSESSELEASVLVDRTPDPHRRSQNERQSLPSYTPKRDSKWEAQNSSAFFRELSLSRIDEHHEISIVGTRPDGRSMSLTLSVSTPLPDHSRTSRPVLPSSGLRHSSIWKSLSPLSEFSINQDDSRHMRARHLAGDDNRQVVVSRVKSEAAVVVEELVQTLTKVEPDEPYWDFMRALHLKKKELSNIYMLDEFCPRIEELDISDNSLQHLNGAPKAIRQLDVRNNCLSSLSSWDHLVNLQYLDVSGNGIDNLEAFSSLVHLRELKADDNHIRSLEGLLDLDGLLSLSLKRNKLVAPDFGGAEMKRLSTLDMQQNSIVEISNLHLLPCLSRLDLGDNELERFPSVDDSTRRCSNLNSLQIPRNKLRFLDVRDFPNLRCLDVDENLLLNIEHVGELKSLHVLSARSQHLSMPNQNWTIGDSLDDFCEVRHLFLSGNAISHLNVKKPFLNLQTLELAYAGLQSLPSTLESLAPNLRVVNLNSNSLKTIRALYGIAKLQKLFVAGNRLSRLRKTMKALGSLSFLEEVDLRDNPMTLGYYPLAFAEQTTDRGELTRLQNNRQRADDESSAQQLRHLLPQSCLSDMEQELERLHLSHLDEDTQLRRRLYELLLAANCQRIERVDGRIFDKDRVLSEDEVWGKLVALGVVERLDEEQ